jgi:hypothetical protein
MQNTLLNDLVRYINKYRNGQKIRRTKIVENVGVDSNTVDVYRCYLTRAGYLTLTSKLGTYRKVKHIPVRASKRYFQQLGYGYVS